ncbi:MAG: histidinol-phosphatase, partial [Gammaproteobacteria bacterium]
MTTTSKIAFLDRDGCLILEPADEQVDRLDKVALVPGVMPALLRLRDAGYEFVMVTNQDGLGTSTFPQAAFRQVQDFVLGLFGSQGITFSRIFVCPHQPDDGCTCRKPSPGLLGDFLSTVTIDRARSFVAGDRATDMEFARNIGVQGFRVDPADSGSWAGIAHTLVDSPRTATVRRTTRETLISATVDLDAESPVSIHTGIGFFDHMLEQIAKHGGFSLTLNCDGD